MTSQITVIYKENQILKQEEPACEHSGSEEESLTPVQQ